MKQEQFIAALQSAGAAADRAETMLDVPVEDAGLDSLELEMLWTILEKETGRPIGEELWQTAPTLRDLMDNI